MTMSAINSASQYPQSNHEPKATIAYLTSVTDCPLEHRQNLIDAAAVLKHSIHRSSIRNPKSLSHYDYQMYAFVHTNASACAEPLRHIGYTVLVRENPVELYQVEKEWYRKRLTHPKAGCCQEREFLKLYSYTMLEYPLVVHLDLDFLVLKPMDELFDAFFQPDSDTKHIQHSMWLHERQWIGRIETMFTRDYPMAKPGQQAVKVGMQGGFLIVRPNQTAFDELVGLIRQGNFKNGWHDGTGNVHYPGVGILVLCKRIVNTACHVS